MPTERKFAVLAILTACICLLALYIYRHRLGQTGRIDNLLISTTGDAQKSFFYFGKGARTLFERYLWLVKAKERNEELEKEVGYLRTKLAALQEVELENTRVRQLLQFRESMDQKLIAAHVIAHDVSSDYTAIRIDKGFREGVQVGMGVISPSGVVGRILRTSSRHADVVTLVDPTSNIDASLNEIDRAVNELKLRGILLRIPINGKPADRAEFFPLYEKMCALNLPIWLHPYKNPKVPDYPDETESKYIIWHMWGLMVESTYSMTRLVFSGVMAKFPKLRIIIHHCGAMVPYFSERISNHYNQSEMRNKTNFTVGLTETPADYFRRFYTDTALIGNTPALMCAYDFYGAEKMLFGTDSPFDAQLGDYGTKRTIRAVEQMDIPEREKRMIFEGNARKLLRLPV